MHFNRLSQSTRPVIRRLANPTHSAMNRERATLEQEVVPKLEKSPSESHYPFQADDQRKGLTTKAGIVHCKMLDFLAEL